MFKKAFTTNQGHKVSGADRKKLRRAIEKLLQPSEDVVEALLPAKAGDLELAKLPAPSRMCLYLLDGVPILVDSSGKGDLWPTVMGLWRAPALLPQVFLKHAAVSQYVVNGADLMLPGVDVPAEGLPDFKKGAVVSVCVRGNPAPIGIGVAAMASDSAQERVAGSLGKGKLLEMLQVYGDHLWSDYGAILPNEGFLANGVVPLDWDPASQEATQQAEHGGAEQQQEQAQPHDPWEGPSDSAAAASAAAAAAAVASTGRGSAPAGAGSEARDAEVRAAFAAKALQQLGVNDSGRDDGNAATNGSGEASTSGSEGGPQAMDALLEAALLQALHKSVKDDLLPLASAALWAQHLLPARPVGASLDVKKSSHKKLSTFLKTYAKAGLIQVKEEKHSGDTLLVGVNRTHQLYGEFRPHKAAGTATGSTESSGTGSGELIVEELYKPVVKEVKAVFEALGLPTDGLYTAAEAGEAAFGYVKHAQLEARSPDSRMLELDALLCDALFKGLIKKGDAYPTHLPKAELRQAFLRRLQPQTRMRRGTQQVLRKGSPPSVHISTERRQGNKRVTHIVGAEGFMVDAEELAGECQRRFACSTSVVELPGKNQGHEVLVQGNVVEKVAALLVERWGIPKQFVAIKLDKKS